MKRWHEEWTITHREWKEHRLIHVETNESSGVGYEPCQRQPGSDPWEVDCACDEQAGRFRKRDAYDCGNPGCLLCHGDKFPRRKLTRQEIIAGLRFQEQVQELWQGKR
jgi:hypothetical protein